jgi:predicted metal-dependent hydrolase
VVGANPSRSLQPVSSESVVVEGQRIAVRLVRHPRARRYLLRVERDGGVRVTMPLAGNRHEALAFAHRSTGWIARQLRQRQTEGQNPDEWSNGAEILFRGEQVALRIQPHPLGKKISFADQTLFLAETDDRIRMAVERYLRKLAEQEIPPRAIDLALKNQARIKKVTIRNQRSRWGSCSARGTISLNWRLIQTPAWVRDYIILHELTHLREMNHSPRFWHEVATVCPDYRLAESWLRKHGKLLR